MAKKKFQWEGDGLPTLTLGDDWEGKISLPVWRGWACKGENLFGRRGRPSTGRIDVAVVFPGEEESEPADEQRRALLKAVEHQEAIQTQIVKSVLRYYADFTERCGFEEAWFVAPGQLELPVKFKNAAELAPHVRLTRLHVHNTFLKKSAYVGYEFECSWDIEHGLGVVMHDKKVIEVGMAETASVGHGIDDYDRQHNPVRIAASKVAPAELNHIDINEAILEGNLAWVKALLKDGASPDKPYHGAGTSNAVQMAASRGAREILAALLKHSKRRPPAGSVWSALAAGSVPSARMLVRAGAKPKKVFLGYAIHRQDPKALALLLGAGLQPEPRHRKTAQRIAEKAEGSDRRKANAIVKLLEA